MLAIILLGQVFLFALYTKGSFGREFVVRVEGGPMVAELLAIETGHVFKGPVLGFDDTYVFLPDEKDEFHPNQQKRGSISKRIVNDQRVLWAEEQTWKSREKRDFLTIDPADVPKERVKRIGFDDDRNNTTETSITNNVGEQNHEARNGSKIKNRRKRYIVPNPNNVDETFNDELWNQQWYLKDTRTRLDLPKLDLNVLPVYRAGITGKGVRITILDDGIEYTHEDLSPNYTDIYQFIGCIYTQLKGAGLFFGCYGIVGFGCFGDPSISYNCNEENPDPLPRYEATKSNSHGTRCAGEVAMVANNRKCGVGIAFNAKIGGVKMLDGLVTDRIEGTALGYAQDLVDIYSASWGPNDDGKTVDGPGRLAKEAIERGIKRGRGGRGSIYVWASGNGGSRGDNCNCDGYLASPYTISIGSASQKGEFPWYGEACASTLAVTYSSGAYKDQMIATTDLKNECTIKHTGTSASAPLAAGIIALALEVNPDLTWRDVQHLVVWTSELAPVADNPGWQRNGAGFWFSNKFGFGLMNAFGLVSAAANWTRVPEAGKCEVRFDRVQNATISYANPAKLYAFTKGCQGKENEVMFLEHVEITTTIDYTIRGSLDIQLISPAGTSVQLLSPRKFDKSSNGFENWTFMSVMTWGEQPSGTWTLVVSDNVGPEGNFGRVGETTMSLRGTKKPPAHMTNGPRNYNEDYNRIHNRVGSAKLTNLPKDIFDYEYNNYL